MEVGCQVSPSQPQLALCASPNKIDVHSLQAQRQLQLSLEAHGRYISSLIERDRAQGNEAPLDSAFQHEGLDPVQPAYTTQPTQAQPSTAGIGPGRINVGPVTDDKICCKGICPI